MVLHVFFSWTILILYFAYANILCSYFHFVSLSLWQFFVGEFVFDATMQWYTYPIGVKICFDFGFVLFFIAIFFLRSFGNFIFCISFFLALALTHSLSLSPSIQYLFVSQKPFISYHFILLIHSFSWLPRFPSWSYYKCFPSKILFVLNLFLPDFTKKIHIYKKHLVK